MARPASLEARLDRLESESEIRQLVAKYCLALDMRDLDALCGLFPEDVRVSKHESGRRALRRWFDETLRVQFTGTAHVTGNHIVEFDDADHARGLVYSRNEHETGDAWISMTMMYWDRYERIAGRWLFRRRLPLYWYACDLRTPPVGENKMRWPGRAPWRLRGLLPELARVLGARLRGGRRRRAAGAARRVPHAYAPERERSLAARALSRLSAGSPPARARCRRGP